MTRTRDSFANSLRRLPFVTALTATIILLLTAPGVQVKSTQRAILVLFATRRAPLCPTRWKC